MRRAAAWVVGGLLMLGLGAVPPARADDPMTVQVTIQDHRFSPAEIHVKAKQRSVLEITNADPTPEEFESPLLAIEKLVTGQGHIVVRLPPLGPGRYSFMGDFNQATAQGVIIAE